MYIFLQNSKERQFLGHIQQKLIKGVVFLLFIFLTNITKVEEMSKTNKVEEISGTKKKLLYAPLLKKRIVILNILLNFIKN